MYRLRPVQKEDFSFLYQLHVDTMKDYVAQTWGWDEAAQLGMFAEGFRPEVLQMIVVDDTDAGMLRVERGPQRLFLAAIEIATAWQRRGIGTAIVTDLLEEARTAGLPLELMVLKVNPARRLYDRLGFAVVDETATHYRMEAR
jgi:ribosomal protein S18 acetylase RimI-like enzyme